MIELKKLMLVVNSNALYPVYQKMIKSAISNTRRAALIRSDNNHYLSISDAPFSNAINFSICKPFDVDAVNEINFSIY
jgi:hypothetical protein